MEINEETTLLQLEAELAKLGASVRFYSANTLDLIGAAKADPSHRWGAMIVSNDMITTATGVTLCESFSEALTAHRTQLQRAMARKAVKPNRFNPMVK